MSIYIHIYKLFSYLTLFNQNKKRSNWKIVTKPLAIWTYIQSAQILSTSVHFNKSTSEALSILIKKLRQVFNWNSFISQRNERPRRTYVAYKYEMM